MKTTPVVSDLVPDSAPAVIKCVIIYEDSATGVHAKHFAEMLADWLCGSCDCESLWRSELLDFPELGDGVAREAAASDFVILGLRGDRALSFGFKRWIQSWLTPTVNRGCSLITLFDPNRSAAPTASGARYFLRDMSATAGIAFFALCPSRNDVPSALALADHAGEIERPAPRRHIVRRQEIHEIPVTA